MPKRILIDPVTRIEGHAKISIYLDDEGNVSDAEFHVVEFRGFEKFCEGRPYAEMPGITPRICGICPVSHLLASAKAGDAIMAVNIPPAADKLRRLMNLGQMIQSHALSFFHLSAPDFLMGWDTPQEKRNVFGLIASNTDKPQDLAAAIHGRPLYCLSPLVLDWIGQPVDEAYINYLDSSCRNAEDPKVRPAEAVIQNQLFTKDPI